MFVYEDVGPANGFDSTNIFTQYPHIGINDDGHVAGMFAPSPIECHAFVKSPGQPLQDLGTEGSKSCAVDISKDKVIIGNSGNTGLIWYPDGIGGYIQKTLPYLDVQINGIVVSPERQQNVPTKINDNNDILVNWYGWDSRDDFPPWMRTIAQAAADYCQIPFDAQSIHDNSTRKAWITYAQILGSPQIGYPGEPPYKDGDGLIWFGKVMNGFGINNSLVTVGFDIMDPVLNFGNKSSTPSRATIWYPPNYGKGPWPFLLGDFGLGHGYAHSINNANKVVGYALTASGFHACLWPEVGQIEDLGSLAGESYAMAINDNDWIVGHNGFNTSNNPFADVRAFLRTPNDKMMWDLNHLVTNLPDGVVLKYALAINNNDNGQIAGYTSEGRPFRLIPDNQPPTGSITINNGDTFSGSHSVTLFLSASDPEAAAGTPSSGVGWVRFSDHQEGGQDTWSGWFPYDPMNPTKTWTFNSDGTRYVKAQFQDKAGNKSAVLQDDIFVDTTPPSINVRVNDGSLYTRSPNATLYLNTDPDVTQMRFGLLIWASSSGMPVPIWGSWTAYQPSVSWTLSEGPNYKLVQFRDGTGNLSNQVRAEVILDTKGPTQYALSIANGRKSTGTPYVDLKVTGGADSGSGVALIRFSDEWHLGLPVWKPWEPYIPDNPGEPNPIVTKSWTLSGGDGVKNMCAQLADSLGNVSGGFPAEASITLDTTRPKDGTLRATPGRFSITLDCAGFEDTGSGINLYRVWASTRGFPLWSAPAKTAILTGRPPLKITGLKQATTYYFRVQAVDNAGNISLPGPTIKANTLGVPLPFLNFLLGD
jgi:probable HAF family extracellular repeat protein